MSPEEQTIEHLKSLLLEWRRAEKAFAIAVLRANHPDFLRELERKEVVALGKLRAFVDSEPWPNLK